MTFLDEASSMIPANMSSQTDNGRTTAAAPALGADPIVSDSASIGPPAHAHSESSGSSATTTTANNKPSKRKKSSADPNPNPNPTKRSKSVAKHTNTNTLPIHRGKFKSRFLQKHAFLTRRADPPVGLLVSCASAAETRALGQVRKFMDDKMVELFPEVVPVWREVQKSSEVDMRFVVDDEGKPVAVGDKALADLTPTDDGKEPLRDHAGDEVPGDGQEVSSSPSATSEVGATEGKQGRQALFQMYDSGCAGLLFMRFRNSVDPKEFVLRLFDHISNSPDKAKYQSADLSFCHRFVPIHHVCSAATEHDIVCSFGPLVKDIEALGSSVAIVFESRNAPAIERKSFIPKLAAELPSTMKVDLVNPEVVVFVTVFKGVAGMTIVSGDEYRRTKRFNVQQL
ncbi:hypothetical protein BCR44DRAFT_77267 [Catenaria anguillulae PL171]|uniref:THUMP domain-containing protein n=1 Tax=Catenaria anguillulae PL171 TaxID=765915 RepID=A0A1Y2HJR3_9FUNG|nr:hypothetical protein BCR44DRAFT_77267 [Catenaria anguillulae PL171]